MIANHSKQKASKGKQTPFKRKKKKSKLGIFQGKEEDKSDQSIIGKWPKRDPVREVDKDQTMKIL